MVVEVTGLSAGYAKTEILHSVEFTAQRGEIVTILGKNGCGKSTLLKALLGFIPHTAGTIRLDGQDITRLSAQDVARLAAYLPQTKQTADITVGRLVLHGRFPYLSYPRRYSRKDQSIAESAMEKMGILDLQDRPLTELSGGMRQKAYIAMALAQEAPIIVMDEPTTYLDVGQQMKVAGMVKSLAKDGKTVLLVLHDVLMALMLSDRIVVLEEGRVLTQGTPADILSGDVIRRLYGVTVKTIDTPEGVQYYYERQGGWEV